MKLFRWLLFSLALAVTGAFAWHWLARDPGYAQIVWGGWSIESTGIVFVLGLLLLWAVLAALLWLIRQPLRLWRRQRRRAARERLGGGLLALHEGRWRRAEKLLVRAASDRVLRLPALLYAAQAAEASGDSNRAGRLLQRAAAANGEEALLLVRCEQLLRDGQAAAASERLNAAAARAPLPPRGVILRLRALAQASRADEALRLLIEGRNKAAVSPDYREMETEIGIAVLRQAAAENLIARWKQLPRRLRHMPLLVDVFASRAAELGLAEEGVTAIEEALKYQWDEMLALRYGLLPVHQAATRIAHAESWLTAHPNSAALLIALGRLCRGDQLFGKAEEYLHQAIAEGGGALAWQALADLYIDQADDRRARISLENALRLQQGQPLLPFPPRSRITSPLGTEASEERDANGVPRLREGLR